MDKGKCCCEYCAWACNCDSDKKVWCGKQDEIISAKRYRKCDDFDFNEISVFDPDKVYKPRIVKPTLKEVYANYGFEQMRL